MRRKIISTRAVSDEFDTVIIVAGNDLRIVSVESGGNPAVRIGETHVVSGQYRDETAVSAAVHAEWV